jgi:hypothetical protein
MDKDKFLITVTMFDNSLSFFFKKKIKNKKLRTSFITLEFSPVLKEDT